MASDGLHRALDDDGGSLKLRTLPPDVRDLLVELDAPPRLAAHLRAVHDVAARIVAWIQQLYPNVSIDASAVLVAAAFRDKSIGSQLRPARHHGRYSPPLMSS